MQCELAQTDPLLPDYFDLKERSEDLLDEHQSEWAQEVKQDVRKAAFNRGFIDTVTVRARAFAKEADSLFRATPVHWLRFNYLKGAGQQLAAMPELSQIRFLDLSRLKIPYWELVAILKSNHWSSLEALRLTDLEFSLDRGIGTAICQSRIAEEP